MTTRMHVRPMRPSRIARARAWLLDEVAWLNGGTVPTWAEARTFVAVSAAAGFVGWSGVVMFLIVTGPR